MIDIHKIPEREEPMSVVLVRPDYFKVVDVKNPYMSGSEIDLDLALRQWEALHDIYIGLRSEGIIDEVHVIDGVKGLEDMVYCANQSLPYKTQNGSNGVVMSNMRYFSRKREVPHFRSFYESLGYRISTVPKSLLLEGMGDAIFHPYKQLLWMGHGYRTSLESADHLERILNMKVLPLHLESEYFYHLDTCFLPVNEDKVILCPDAFNEESMKTLQRVFSEVITVDRQEAVDTFCLNTHCIYRKSGPVAITPSGGHSVKAYLLSSGYRVIEANTSEFIKAGGSVYCMKMMIY